MKFRAALFLIGCLGGLWDGLTPQAGEHGQASTANTPVLSEFPPIQSWTPELAEREKLRRSLTLLSSSTPTDPKTVRVLFYGQSITQQSWWKELANYLRNTYTTANLILENRAIGGHSSQLLVKTAEADLYPFRPDLVIFHVYGSHSDYEQIIKNIRERTCADILLQTDHVTRDAALTEETDPAKLSPKEWDAWMNNAFLPEVARRYGACRADIHPLWKSYLQNHNLKAADLLRDGVHLNARGERLMAELLKPYLAPLPAKSAYDPMNNERVRTIPMSLTDANDSARVVFNGRRVDLVFRPGGTGEMEAIIDGKRPSQRPELYGFTRVSAFPNSDWPILLKVGSAAPLLEEEWTMRIDEASADGKVCAFSLRGSATGPDGSGISTNRFVSQSGRIVIEPDDWNVAYSIRVFQRPLPSGCEAKWKAILQGRDQASPPAQTAGIENAVTLADGLTDTQHVLELRGKNPGELISAVRIYAPKIEKK